MQTNNAYTDVSSPLPATSQQISSAASSTSKTRAKTGSQQQIDRIAAPFVATGALMPTFISFITVIFYFIHLPFLPDLDLRWNALLYGVLSLVIIWPVTAWCFSYFVTARGMNPHSESLLKSRFALLETKIESLEPMYGQVQPTQLDPHNSEFSKILAFKQARALKDRLQNDFINSSQGVQWVTGYGYLNAWHLLHCAEEALITVEPLEQVLADAMHDQINLQNATLKNRRQLLEVLSQAVKELSCDTNVYVKIQSGENTNGTQDGGQTSIDSTQSLQIGKAEERARCMLRHIRRELNKFRDINWQGIMRQRTQLAGTIFLTGMVTYLLLCISIAAIPHPHNTPDANFVAATAFYFIGALAGLFDRFYRESQAKTGITSIDDYGLSLARLIAVPLLSGLAAIGGVVITETLIALAKNNSIIWHDIFSPDNAQNLLTAAIFGLAPNLLIRNLQQNAEKFASGLQKTHIAGPE